MPPPRSLRTLRASRTKSVEPATTEPTELERPVIERVCRAVVERRMTTPALIYLEMSKPLNFIGSQAMHFFQPIVSAVLDTRSYEAMAQFLERRGSVDYMVERLERLEAAWLLTATPQYEGR